MDTKPKRNRAQHPPYECYRCGYSTNDKSKMHVHLYKNKKTCPPLKNRVEWSEGMKEDIMTMRSYIAVAEKEAKPVNIYNIVNNMNQIQNFVSGLDFERKKEVLYDKDEHVFCADCTESLKD